MVPLTSTVHLSNLNLMKTGARVCPVETLDPGQSDAVDTNSQTISSIRIGLVYQGATDYTSFTHFLSDQNLTSRQQED